MKKHIDTAQIVGSNIDFLTKETVAHRFLTQNLFRFQKQ
jgi:hypothetical protein